MTSHTGPYGPKIRHSDVIRTAIIDNVLTSFLPAVSWEEDSYPFNQRDSGVVYCTQAGRPVDAFVRNVEVDVLLFSPANANGQQKDDLYDSAESVSGYLRLNPVVSDNFRISMTSDVGPELFTGQNRVYRRLSIMCMTL